LAAGCEVLAVRGNALDAVTRAAIVLDDEPLSTREEAAFSPRPAPRKWMLR
jgi:isoaspartyl peptidase/L-asparaginase-like protein (Ntn-hydrolase superfamily)